MCPERFDVLASAISAVVPFGLFTVLTVEWEEGLVKRAYSTDEINYPSGGIKRLMDSSWALRVIHSGEAFIASTEEEMAEAFSDHELLSSLGLHKAMNVPIRHKGKTVCSLNLLRNAQDFGPHEGYKVLQVFNQWKATHSI